MQIYKHIFALIFILLLIIVIIFLLKKGNLHLKLLKNMYPNQFKRINTIYNPLLVIYLLKLDFDMLLWFSLPIYFPNNKVKQSSSEEINIINKKLIRNNTAIFYSISLMLIWIITGMLFIL